MLKAKVNLFHMATIASYKHKHTNATHTHKHAVTTMHSAASRHVLIAIGNLGGDLMFHERREQRTGAADGDRSCCCCSGILFWSRSHDPERC